MGCSSAFFFFHGENESPRPCWLIVPADTGEVMDEVLEKLSGFWPSGRKDWWSGGFVELQQVLRGSSGVNISMCLQEVSKSPVCGGLSGSRAGRTGELLPQGDSGVKIQDFSKMPFLYNEFVLNPLLLQLLNHSSSTDGGVNL